MPKISIIGAGSVVFANRLIFDLMSFHDLTDLRVSLMDIDGDRLQVAHKFSQRLLDKTGSPAKIEATLDRRACLQDADFVISAVQVGGYEATATDFDIPERYGIKQTIADTHGIGGIMRALRTIPVVVSIAQDMEDLCPHALFLNYSNPMAMNVWGIFDATSINTVGLCHSIQGTAAALADYLDIPRERLKYRAAGINHICWYLTLEAEGRDLYPELREKMDEPEIFSRNPVRFEVMRQFGHFVSESSEHMAEYVPYFMKFDSEIERLRIPVREYLRRCDRILERFEENRKMADGEIALPEWKRSHEYASFIVHSMTTGVRRAFHGNVKNTGLVTNLPEGCCVEVPCMVDANGIQATHVGALPPQLAAIDQAQISVQALTVKAALEKNLDAVYHAALLDPLASSILPMDKIVHMVDALLDAHARYLDYLPRPSHNRLVMMAAAKETGPSDRIM